LGTVNAGSTQSFIKEPVELRLFFEKPFFFKPLIFIDSWATNNRLLFFHNNKLTGQFIINLFS